MTSQCASSREGEQSLPKSPILNSVPLLLISIRSKGHRWSTNMDNDTDKGSLEESLPPSYDQIFGVPEEFRFPIPRSEPIPVPLRTPIGKDVHYGCGMVVGLPVPAPQTVSMFDSILSRLKYPKTPSDVKRILEERYAGVVKGFDVVLSNMNIHQIIPIPAYRYTLETTFETRKEQIVTVPYGPGHQEVVLLYDVPLKNKWEVQVQPPSDMNIADADSNAQGDGGGGDFEVEIDVPGSSRMKQCNSCNSTGSLIKVESPYDTSNCLECDGTGIQIFWKKISVSWSTSVRTFQTDREELSSKRLEQIGCDAELKVLESSVHSRPLKFPQDASIYPVARDFMEKEIQKQREDLKILKFKQRLGAISVVKVWYDTKLDNELRYFYIYGGSNHVYFPDGLPESFQNCQCCNIV